jgi:protein arginine N-methyltransferase 5
MEQYGSYRSTLALHVAQDEIPLGQTASTSANAQQQESEPVVGYGPPRPSAPTPLQRLAQQHLNEDSEFELICAPLTNGNWQQRWESLCVASAPGPVATTSSKMLAIQYESMQDMTEDMLENAQRAKEAELWRLAGAFRRGEVNATRSGKYTLLCDCEDCS